MEWIFGFLIAATVGMTGIGGGSFTVPVLLLFGIPATEAVGTAMIYAAVLRVVAAPFYMVRGNVHARYLGLLLVGAVPGVLLGTWALYLLRSPSWKQFVLLMLGMMLAFSSLLTFVPRLRNPHFAKRKGPWLALFAFPIGVETGFSSAGAGALGTILLMNFSEMTAAQVVGTDLVFGIVVALVGSAFHLSWGSVNSVVLIRLLAGGLPGVLVGCALARQIPGGKLRVAVAVIAIVLGLQLVWTGGGGLLAAR